LGVVGISGFTSTLIFKNNFILRWTLRYTMCWLEFIWKTNCSE